MEPAMTQAVAKATSKIEININLATLEEVKNFCAIIAKTEMVPKAYQGKPDNIMVAAIMGKEIGLPFMQSLQSIAVINGMPSIYGDAGLALVRGSNLLEEFDEWFELDGARIEAVDWPAMYEAGKNVLAVCESKRIGLKKRKTMYGIKDAIASKLWGKTSSGGTPSPWVTTPGRMMMFRARGYNLRDNFGDVLKGMRFYEEAMDMEQDTTGTFVVAQPAAPTPTTLGGMLKTAKVVTDGKTLEVPTQSTSTAAPKPPATDAPAVETPPVPETPQPEPQPEPEPEPESAQVELPPAEIEKVKGHIAELNKTAKGRAMLAALRKDVKLGPMETYPMDSQRFTLFAQGLVLLVAKVQVNG